MANTGKNGAGIPVALEPIASERMLADVHTALVGLVYEYGGIDPKQVTVQFGLPLARTVQAFTGPTILFSLVDLWENLDLRNTGFVRHYNEENAEFRSTPRYFDLRYLVSAYAASAEDEFAIVSRLVWTLYRHHEIPEPLLPEGFVQREWQIKGRLLAGDESPRALSILSDLGAEPHCSLVYVATAPIDIERASVDPLVLTRVIYTAPIEEVEEDPDPFAVDPWDARKKDEEQDITASSRNPENAIFSYGGHLTNKAGDRLAGYRVRLAEVGHSATITDQKGRFIFHKLTLRKYTLNVVSPEGKRLPDVVLEVRTDLKPADHRIEIDAGEDLQ